MTPGKYPKYKDSGVEWVGGIPEGWVMIKLRNHSYMKGRIGWQGLRADEFIESGPYLITGMHFANDSVDWKTCYHITKERYDEAPEIHVKKNDVLITKDGTIGKLAYIDELPGPASLNSHVLLIRPSDNAYLSRYLYWYLQSDVFNVYVNLKMTGTTFYGITQTEIENFKLGCPTTVEQEKIICFLDIETSKLQQLIDFKYHQIELLHEHEKSLIHQAVTKGLDPNAKMKDSGVEWIGKIPEHYSISKLKKIADYLNGLPFKPEEWGDDGLPIIRIQNLTDETKPFNNYNGEFDEEYRVENNDLLVSWSATIGIFRWSRGSAILNQHIFKVTTKSNIDNQFYYYLVSAALAEMISKTHGSTMTHIIDKHFRNFYTPQPPLNEQRQIAQYLDSQIAKIHQAINTIEAQIEKLEEYRKSLIYEVVTGKVKVS